VPTVEFHVDGIAVSHQSRNRARKIRYIQDVRAAAEKAMAGVVPWPDKLRLTLWILTIGSVAPVDNDNVLKLVRDALEGIVYVNDGQVRQDNVWCHDLHEPVRLHGIPGGLAALATRGAPFIYVRLTTNVDWTVIA
jgi:crossover junction endodeoxyribonuclease RusA